MMDIVVAYVAPVVHVLACFFLIVVVLLQTGKGADIGAVVGGGSQTLFGSSGAGNLMTKLTTGTAIAFMITSLILSYGQSRTSTSSLLEKLPTEAGAPATPPQPRTVPAPVTSATLAIPVVPAPAPAGDAPAKP